MVDHERPRNHESPPHDGRAKDARAGVREAGELLSAEECAAVIDAVRPRLRPSTPVVGHLPLPACAAPATAHVACILREDAFSAEVDGIFRYLRELIAELSGLPQANQEPFQIVRHPETGPPGPHAGILFPGWEYLKWETDSGGERVFSFVLHLNDVASGGETECPRIGGRIRPEAGKAAFWRNPLDGARHGRGFAASHPVARGEKWALACWVRETAFLSTSRQEVETLERRGGWNLDGIRAAQPGEAPRWLREGTRRQQERVPYLGAGGRACRGFEKRELDRTLFAEIRTSYESIVDRLRPETDAAIGTYLETVSRDAPPALFCEDSAFNQHLLEKLRPLHEEWCGFSLEPSACYGFRVYLPGAYLHDHVDVGATHIVSSTICVDRDVRAPWPLHVLDVDGREFDVDQKPGELVLYESARIAHGRPTPLDGRFHVGIFVHYRPTPEWEGWAAFPTER